MCEIGEGFEHCTQTHLVLEFSSPHKRICLFADQAPTFPLQAPASPSPAPSLPPSRSPGHDTAHHPSLIAPDTTDVAVPEGVQSITFRGAPLTVASRSVEPEAPKAIVDFWVPSDWWSAGPNEFNQVELHVHGSWQPDNGGDPSSWATLGVPLVPVGTQAAADHWLALVPSAYASRMESSGEDKRQVGAAARRAGLAVNMRCITACTTVLCVLVKAAATRSADSHSTTTPAQFNVSARWTLPVGLEAGEHYQLVAGVGNGTLSFSSYLTLRWVPSVQPVPSPIPASPSPLASPSPGGYGISQSPGGYGLHLPSPQPSPSPSPSPRLEASPSPSLQASPSPSSSPSPQASPQPSPALSPSPSPQTSPQPSPALSSTQSPVRRRDGWGRTTRPSAGARVVLFVVGLLCALSLLSRTISGT